MRSYFFHRALARRTGFNVAKMESAFPIMRMEAHDANVTMAILENLAVSQGFRKFIV